MSFGSEKFSLNISLIIPVCLQLCLYETTMCQVLHLMDQPWNFLFFIMHTSLTFFGHYSLSSIFNFLCQVLSYNFLFCHQIYSFLELPFSFDYSFFFFNHTLFLFHGFNIFSEFWEYQAWLLLWNVSPQIGIFVQGSCFSMFIFFPSFITRNFLQMSGDSCLLRVKDWAPKGWEEALGEAWGLLGTGVTVCDSMVT